MEILNDRCATPHSQWLVLRPPLRGSGPGGVKPLRYLERELGAFRGHDGQAAILDAYCPHLGAVYFWHDAGGAPPDFEIPEIPEWGDRAFASSWQRHEWTVRTHPQEVLENGIDWAHVMPVHGFETPGKIVCNFEGPRFDWGLDTGKSIELLGDAQDSFRFRVHSYGLGVSEVHYEGRFATVFQIGQTPVEADTTRITFSILIRQCDEADPETAPALRAYVEDQVRTFEQDFPIWENKLYRERPPLCDADGPIPEFRNWAAQFYPPVAEMQTPT